MTYIPATAPIIPSEYLIILPSKQLIHNNLIAIVTSKMLICIQRKVEWGEQQLITKSKDLRVILAVICSWLKDDLQNK